MSPPAATDAPPGSGRQVLRPAQLNAMARDLLEGSFPMVWVEAEISNLSQPASGHMYFTLKDERAQVRCALFRQRAQRIGFRPANGQQVLARGRLTLYEPRGDYQLVLDHMEQAGAGALGAAFEALKARLSAAGLFDPAGKPPLPRFARRLALITSPRGAAVRDVLSVLARRFPLLQVEVLPVPVQGEGAAAEIVRTLDHALGSGRYDTVLLTRGGGSLEDLWCFNDETLVRRVAAARLPVVAAVGHEIDFSLVEFAAALRAPTPSAAAELLVPDERALRARLQGFERQLQRAATRHLERPRQRLDHAFARLQAQRPQRRLEHGSLRLGHCRQRLAAGLLRALARAGDRLGGQRRALMRLHPGLRLDATRSRLARAAARQHALLVHAIDTRRQRLDGVVRTMQAVGPLSTLERGYAILLDPDSGHVVRRRGDVMPGQQLLARLADGEVRLQALPDQPGTATSARASGRAKKKP